MKKVIIIIFILSVIYLTNSQEEVIIPKESIRFRIIANSNSLNDQLLKNNIKEDLINSIIPDILNANSLKDSREIINTSIPAIKEVLDNYETPYQINFGSNYFPEKKYNGITYNKGLYESLVIELGNGIGDNFWCVLYPPLCLIEQQSNQNKNIYKSYIKEALFNS